MHHRFSIRACGAATGRWYVIQETPGGAVSAIAGIVLAAGGGRRFGGPKAVAEVGGERLVDRACRVLREGGCAPVIAVLGAAVVPGAGADDVVVNPEWADGMGSSLRAGLAAAGADGDARTSPPPSSCWPTSPGCRRRGPGGGGRRDGVVPGHGRLPGRGTAGPATRCCWAATTGPASGSWPGRRRRPAVPAGARADVVLVPVEGSAADVDRPEDLPST
jgi:hypothetical protein